METRVRPEELSTELVNMGYQRVDLVDAPAQFAIRGGIIDIFPLTEELPVGWNCLMMKLTPSGGLVPIRSAR